MHPRDHLLREGGVQRLLFVKEAVEKLIVDVKLEQPAHRTEVHLRLSRFVIDDLTMPIMFRYGHYGAYIIKQRHIQKGTAKYLRQLHSNLNCTDVPLLCSAIYIEAIMQ